MNWFKRWWRSEEPPPPPPEPPERMQAHPHDWVVLPWRIAEACRLSLHTLASHPAIPDRDRLYVANWLLSYNAHLATWFQEHYGPDIFDTLGEISNEVREASEKQATSHADETSDEEWREMFRRWEEELSDETE